MQIGELAKRAGVSVQTIRFYERRGLLPQPQRKDSGYRIYGEESLRRLRFIQQAKALRFSLEVIGKLLRMREKGLSPCCDVISIGERHLAEVEQQIGQLERFRDELARAVKQWKRSGKPQLPAGSICVLIERVMDTNREKIRRKIMAFKEGEVYRCPDPECGCEITVTRGAAPGKGGNQNPRCCCGKEMVRK